MTRDLQAMVLAAGLGERMRPLTGTRAKPSLPLMNRPLILHVLDHLARHGIRRVAVNTHHAPETVEGLLSDGIPGGMNVALSHEPEILGTGGGILAARARFDAGAPLLVLNADSLSDVDLTALAEAHRRAAEEWGASATLAVRGREADDPWAPVLLDGEGRVSGIGRRESEGEAVTFLGIHALSPEALDRLPARGVSDIVRDAYVPILEEGGRLAAWRHSGWWVEIGDPSLYRDAHLRLLREAAFMKNLPSHAGRPERAPGIAFLGPGCRGLGAASLTEVVAGAGCLLEEGASVSRSVLGSRVRVGRKARIEGSVIWDGVEIPEGAVILSRLILQGPGGGGSLRERELP
jgi:NDP-sugar pyrophosphorylase family protein